MALVIAHLTPEKGGTVRVRAIPPSGREGDAKPCCGYFDGRRRYAGQEFMLASWDEYSARWMEFVEPEKVPKEWKEKIESRAKDREEFAEQARARNTLNPMQQMAAQFAGFMQMMSMANVANGGGGTVALNHATGQFTQVEPTAAKKPQQKSPEI